MLHAEEVKRLTLQWYAPSLVCLVLIGLCWVAVASILNTTREGQVAAESRHLHNVATIFAEHAASTIRQADALVQSLKGDIESDLAMGSKELRIPLGKYGLGINSKPVERLMLVDAEGWLVETSIYGHATLRIDLSDRPHIKIHREKMFPGLHIGVPLVSRVTNRSSLYLTRRINAPDGSLGGIAGAVVDPGILSDMYGSVTLGTDAAVFLVGTDGVVRAKVGDAEDKFSQALSTGYWRDLVKSPPAGPFVAHIGKSEQLVDVVPVAGYPLRAVVWLSKADYLRAYYEEQRRLLMIGALATGLLVLAGGAIAGLQFRSNAAFRSLVEAEVQNRHINSKLAVNIDRLESMSENLSIGLCMFDGAGNLVVCNDKFLKMYDLPVEIREREASFSEVVRLCVDNGFWAHGAGDSPADNPEPTHWGRIIEGTSNRSVYDLVDDRSIVVTRQRMATGGWVFTHEDITERRKKDRQIEMLALSDPLTALANRTRLLGELQSVLKAKKDAEGEDQEDFALLLLDLDHFKQVNDSLGHPVGDKLLVMVAERIKQTCRDGDVVARLGGDEFAVIAKKLAVSTSASTLATRLIHEVSQPYLVGSHELIIGVSIGVAMGNSNTTAEALMQDADVALYRAKAEGRNSYRIFAQQMMLQVQQRRLLETELRTAVATNQFEPFFQPIASTATGMPVGYEALARWHHPMKGIIMPGDFVDAAEETGLISPIGAQLFRDACRAMQRAPRGTFLSINISPVQLRNSDFVEKAMRLLRSEGLPPDRLQIEITEAVVLRDDAITQHNLLALRQAGIRIAVDDFGVGYSSLSYLKEYPFDTVKIDKSFTSSVTDNGRGFAIVKAIVDLAQAIGMDVTAEGVETEQQFMQLKSIGCSKVQGYLFGRPATSDILFGQCADLEEDEASSGRIVA